MAVSLVDTNVLVYAHDPRDRRKQETARAVVRRLFGAEQAVVSVQSFSEFYVAVRRLPEPMTHAEATRQIERIAHAARVVDVTSAVAFEALRGTGEHSLSIWDGLIWAAAKLNQVAYVVTEDFQHQRVLEGVTFLDPFAATFDESMLG